LKTEAGEPGHERGERRADGYPDCCHSAVSSIAYDGSIRGIVIRVID
jgi:hypothetical protein